MDLFGSITLQSKSGEKNFVGRTPNEASRTVLSPVSTAWARLLFVVTWVLFFAAGARAQNLSLTNLFLDGELHAHKGEHQEALKYFLKAHELSPTNVLVLCRISRQYCDLMFSAKTPAEQKSLCQSALLYAKLAVQDGPDNVLAHLSAAICYGKLVPFSDNQTKVAYSRLIKAEAEKAILLDPKEDLGYYVLGCWNEEIAGMGMFLKSMIRLAYGALPKASNENAVADFKKAIELGPNRILNHLGLARVSMSMGNKKVALDELNKCVALTPVDPDDVNAKAKARELLDQLNHK